MPNDYYGLPVERIENEHVAVEYLTTAGPRIVRLFLHGEERNLLAETPQNGWETPYGPYRLYGGHRLWIAPEKSPETSLPDNDPVAVEPIVRGVRLTQRTAPLTRLTKSLEVQLATDGPRVTVTHGVKNDGVTPCELALWGITELPLGGYAFFPCPNEPREDLPLAPNRHIALWPCSRWTDPRLELEEDLITIRGEAGLPSYKVGYLSHHGKVAYLNDTVMFVKEFAPEPDKPHADMNCNAEVYVNDQYLELETLGPLVRLEPGESTRYVEAWTLYRGVWTAEDIIELFELKR
ncbi:MAG: hypothetical protein WCF84_16905 [Anaerolineae bacterium]